MPSQTKAIPTSFLRVLIFNALLAYPVLWLVYKHFNPALTPMDVRSYMAMVDQGPMAVDPPFRYRVLAPLAVRAMRPLPGYPIEVTFTGDAAAKKDFFHFLLFDFAVTVLVSALVFVHLKDKAPAMLAYAGSLLYLCNFYTVVTNLIPMTDAVCHLAIIVCVILFERKRPIGFALACLAGVFAKETLLVVMLPWIAVRVLQERRRWPYLLYTLPAALAYLAAARMTPSAPQFDYYHPSFLIGRVFHAFTPAAYDRQLLFHIFLAQAPLLACLAAYLAMRFFPRWAPAKAPAFVPELSVFFFLIWLGITMGLGNNTGRVAFMAFPAVLLFEVHVIGALLPQSGPKAASA